MNKWTVLIIGTLVFLGVVYYFENLEVEKQKPYENNDSGVIYVVQNGSVNWTDRDFDFYVSSNGEIYEYTDEGLQRALRDLNGIGGTIREHCKVPRVVK